MRNSAQHAACRIGTMAVLILAIDAAEMRAAELAFDLECFTEPYRHIDVAASEMGVIKEILVAEGDQVRHSQTVAKLDDKVLVKSLEVARAAKDAEGALRAAISELKTTQYQLESYRELRRNANATDRELERASAAVAVAEAKVQIVRDEMTVRATEFERTAAQLERRRVQSPILGTVIELKKDVGEFVSPTDPVIMTVVDLTHLKAIFSVPYRLAADIRPGEKVSMRVGQHRDVQGEIEFVSPAMDPQSGTTRVKIRIANLQGEIPCGVICRWNGLVNEDEGNQSAKQLTGARTRPSL